MRLPRVLGLLVGALLLSTPSVNALAIQWSPERPQEGEPVQFTYTDERGDVNSTQWAFGDQENASDASPTHAYAFGWVYDVRLKVTYLDGTNKTTTARVDVALRPPSQVPTFMTWLMPGVVSILLIGIAFVVLTRGQPVIYNRVFFMLYLASGLKGLSESALYFLGYQARSSVPDLMPWLDAGRAIGIVYPHLFLWFVLVFPRPLRPWLKNGWRGSIVALLAIPFLLLEFATPISSIATRNLFNGYVSILALVALGLLVYHAWETDSHEERHRIRLLTFTFFLLVFSTIVVSGLQLLRLEEYALVAGLVIVPMLEILGCLLLMYAILRYQLLGVEVFLKRVTRATTFALLVGTVFVIVSNSVEQLFESKVLGEIRFGFIVAGFISTIMLYPIQKATERFANRLFPQATDATPAHLSARRMEIYEAQLRYALLDGTLKSKELTMLHALRDSLELSTDELVRVAQRFPGLNARVLLAVPSRPA